MRGAPTPSPATPIGRPPTAHLMAPPEPTPSGGLPAGSSQGAQGPPPLHTIGDALEHAKNKKIKQEPQDQAMGPVQLIDITVENPQTEEGEDSEKTIAEQEEEAQRQKEQLEASS